MMRFGKNIHTLLRRLSVGLPLLCGCAFLRAGQPPEPTGAVNSWKQSAAVSVSQGMNVAIIRSNASVDDRKLDSAWVQAIREVGEPVSSLADAAVAIFSPVTAGIGVLFRGAGVALPAKVDADESDGSSLAVVPLPEGQPFEIVIEGTAGILQESQSAEVKRITIKSGAR